MDGRLISHLSLGVADLARSTVFYDAALAPLGYRRVWTTARAAGYGVDGPDEPFALHAVGDAARPAGPGTHVAFTGRSASAVDGFHAAAIASGGKDEGGPGLRPAYGPGYYAAFVRDPDGHKLEAVWHGKV